MSKYVSAILSEEDWDQGSFRINTYTGLLQYKLGEDFTDNIDNEGDDRRASKASDLLNLLKLRNFNLMDSKCVDSSGQLGFISKYDEDGAAVGIEVIGSHISQEDLVGMNSIKSDLLNTQIGLRPVKDLDDGTGDFSESVTPSSSDYYNFDFIDESPRSTVQTILHKDLVSYTDVIDLSRILTESTKVGIRLGIKYTIGDIVSTKDLMFSSDEDMSYVAGSVVIEYFNKCIRLFPSNEVNECIIDYCNLFYE